MELKVIECNRLSLNLSMSLFLYCFEKWKGKKSYRMMFYKNSIKESTELKGKHKQCFYFLLNDRIA